VTTMSAMTATRAVWKCLACALVLAALFALPQPAQAQAKEAAPVPKGYAPAPAPRRGFNIVLLVGEMQGPGYPKPIPAAALKALSDMRDFLPYKGYSLLDTQWIVAGASATALTRLRGLDGQEYELELRASPVLSPGTAAPDAGSLSVRFVLRDGTPAAGGPTKLELEQQQQQKDAAAQLYRAELSREIYQLEQERDDLSIQVTKGRAQVEVGTRDPEDVKRLATRLDSVQRRINDLKKAQDAAPVKAAGRPVIDTSFKMDDGETVVVGTSGVKGGGKALIALLTATSDRMKASSK
jgi:hypothetical protein